jgi:ATP-binding cassette subfamily F protein uup
MKGQTMLITAEKLTLGFPDKPLLREADFYMRQGEKIGVIGPNGSGKSTFLKALQGLAPGQQGKITTAQGLRISALAQEPSVDKKTTVLRQVLKDGRVDGEYEAKTVLTRLGMNEFDRPMGDLSGGQARRVALAAALVTPCELLMLDEPTNHLDNDAIEWLEKYLIELRGGLIMVTHDRYFLERVVTRIVEIDGGELVSYPARYSQYLELKLQRRQTEEAAMRKQKSLYTKELAWMMQGAKARSTKSRERIARFEALAEGVETDQPRQSLVMDTVSSRLGKKILLTRGLSKSLDGKRLIDHFDLSLTRESRLGIIGPNGCGKSTLIKLLSGRMTPDEGEVEVGETVRIGYLSQQNEELSGGLRLIEAVRRVAGEVTTEEGSFSASQMLERFLFPSFTHYQQVDRLSGGERRRLHLLLALMAAPNVLMLDEPTNDLDIETLTVLEDYLESFPGAVLAVSHDRFFLDKMADHILAFEGEGRIRTYLGGYTRYLEQAAPAREKPRREKREPKLRTAPEEKLKFSYKQQREFEHIDGEIADLERELAQVTRQMEQTVSDYVKLQQLGDRQRQLQDTLEERMERWVYLNDLAERIEKQKGKP